MSTLTLRLLFLPRGTINAYYAGISSSEYRLVQKLPFFFSFEFVWEAFETNIYFTGYCSTIVYSTWEFFNVYSVFLDQSGESSAKLSPSGLVHLRSSWPLHWQLCLILFRLCEETTGRLWPSILLFWHGRAWAIKSQRRTLSSRVTWSSSGR